MESRQLLTTALDPSFGNNGVVNLGNGDFSARATQGDGKILIAGVQTFNLPKESQPIAARAYVARLLADGSRDPSFGGVAHGQPQGTPLGTVVFTNKAVLNGIGDIAVLNGGKILLAGSASSPLNYALGAMVKLSSDGKLNTTFGGASHGYAGAPAGSLLYAVADPADPFNSQISGTFEHIAVSSDGRIAATGPNFVHQGSGDFDDQRAELLMFHSDGTLDKTFNHSGVFIANFVIGPEVQERGSLEALTFAPDGNLIVTEKSARGGEESDTNSVSVQAFDLTASGSPGPGHDPTVFHIQQVGESVSADVFQLQPRGDGSYLLLIKQQGNIAVYHLLSNLTVDSTFAEGAGHAVLRLKGTVNFSAPSLSLLKDSRFYISVVNKANSTAYVSRYLANGPIDPIFGNAVVEAAAIDPQTHQPIKPPDHQLITPAGDDVVVITAHSESSSLFGVKVRKVQGGAHLRLTSGGTLLLGGTSDNDVVKLSIRSSDNRLVASIGNVAESFKASTVKHVVLHSYGGNDVLDVRAGIGAVYADGGAGNDTLLGGDGNDTLYGNAGLDSANGGAGNDSLLGGGSNDVLNGGRGKDTLDGGNGSDILNGGDGNDFLLGGQNSTDKIDGGADIDSAANDPLDTYRHVEKLLETSILPS